MYCQSKSTTTPIPIKRTFAAMADNTGYNAAVSEKYTRFVIEIEYTGTAYYTVWGTDATSKDEDDKLLVDAEGKFLLFKTPEAAVDYIKGQNNLFDQKNFDGWAKEIKLPIEPHIAIDLDLLQDEEIDIDEEESFEELINVQNFISDYCHQIDDDYLIDLFLGHPIATLYDLYIDAYIEKTIEPTIPNGLMEDAIPKLNEVYDIISEKIKIV